MIDSLSQTSEQMGYFEWFWFSFWEKRIHLKAPDLKDSPTLSNGFVCNSLFRENIVVVQFFYQEMKEENVIQEPSYDFYKLVGKNLLLFSLIRKGFFQ